MSVQIIVGAQWGDEGKGKIVDHLSENVDIVARYQGGANAGHTVVIGDKTYVLHLIPSGIFHPHVTCVIGNGVVVDPVAFLEEVEHLRKLKIETEGRLLASHNAHLIMPYHKILDTIREKTTDNIGTTGRGIGPAYIDKSMRAGIRLGDLRNRDILVEKIRKNIAEKNQLFRTLYKTQEIDADQIVAEYEKFAEQIRPYLADTSSYLNAAIRGKKRILAEGAQGALLDVDHGTYPYVTSSNPTSGGACTGLGIPPTAITSITGIVKAYTTRVGNGPFPTEQQNEVGEQLRTTGGEYGATTGRPRRCGWFDAVSVRYAVMVNGITSVAITKLDVLDGFEKIRLATGYRIDGRTVESFPTDIETLQRAEPVYDVFDGWMATTANARTFSELPQAAQHYVGAIANCTGTTITMISVGAKREQTILCSSD